MCFFFARECDRDGGYAPRGANERGNSSSGGGPQLQHPRGSRGSGTINGGVCGSNNSNNGGSGVINNSANNAANGNNSGGAEGQHQQQCPSMDGRSSAGGGSNAGGVDPPPYSSLVGGGGTGGGASVASTGGGGANRASVGSTGRRVQRLPSLRLANGRVAVSGPLTGSEEEVRSPRSAAAAAAAALREDIKISLDTTTCTDSLITAVDDETAFVNDFISHEMNYKEPGKVHFGGDEISLYGTPKEEMVPSQVPTAPPTPGVEPKPSFLKNQLQALFQPTDNKLAMKLFGSKKALMKERIRQKAAGHWIIHPCSNFR